MIPYSIIGDVATTLLQYLVLFGVVALGCLPALVVSDVRTRLDRWPTDRFLVNYALVVGSITLGQAVVLIAGWNLLRIGSTQQDPRFRAGRLVAVLVSYPIAVLGLGTAGIRLYCRQRSAEQWVTLRTVAGLGVAAGMYIVTLTGAAIVLFIALLFVALPT